MYCTVGENIIATINLRNNIWYPLKMVIFPILRLQNWTFLYCSPFSYCSSNFAIAKVIALNLALYFNSCISFVDWVMAFCFQYSYCSSNYCDSNSWRSFTLLKALSKSNSYFLLSPLRAIKSKKYRNIGKMNDCRLYIVQSAKKKWVHPKMRINYGVIKLISCEVISFHIVHYLSVCLH